MLTLTSAVTVRVLIPVAVPATGFNTGTHAVIFNILGIWGIKVLNHVSRLGVSCSAAGKVTAGLAESNGSLPPGGRFTVTCELTACTPGSAPGLMLGYEYV